MQKVKLVSIVSMAFLMLLGCSTESTQQSSKRELLQLGKNPPLLPLDQAHKVSYRLTSTPNSISTNDLLTISNLVGRVPGLPRYEIGAITKSTNIQDSFDVWLSPFVVRMKKDPDWQVMKVDHVSY